MHSSQPMLGQYLYEFDQGFEVIYLKYSPRHALADAQLVLTLERGLDRKTFVFHKPKFSAKDKNLMLSQGLYIAYVRGNGDNARIEVGDIQGGFIYFTAHSVRNITPGL